MPYKFHRKGILGIVYRQRDLNIEYLLLHRFYPWKGWEFVKGGLGGRSEEDALENELTDETHLKSLNVQRIPGFKIIYKFSKKAIERGDKCIGQNLQGFLVEVNPEDVVIVNFREHNDFYWTDYQQAMEMLRHSQTKGALKFANRYLMDLMKKK